MCKEIWNIRWYIMFCATSVAGGPQRRKWKHHVVHQLYLHLADCFLILGESLTSLLTLGVRLYPWWLPQICLEAKLVLYCDKARRKQQWNLTPMTCSKGTWRTWKRSVPYCWNSFQWLAPPPAPTPDSWQMHRSWRGWPPALLLDPSGPIRPTSAAACDRSSLQRGRPRGLPSRWGRESCAGAHVCGPEPTKLKDWGILKDV